MCISFDMVTIWKPVISVCAVVRIFIYTHLLSAAQPLSPFRVSTKVKTVLKAFGSGRRDPFLEAF